MQFCNQSFLKIAKSNLKNWPQRFIVKYIISIYSICFEGGEKNQVNP